MSRGWARRWLPFAAVALLGNYLAHLVGYALAPAHSHAVDTAHVHDYMPVLAVVAVPLGLGALVTIAASLRSERGIRSQVLIRRLVGAQITLYGAQEVGERIAAGVDVATIALQLPVLLGLAAQPAVAVLVVVALGVAGRLATAVAGGSLRLVAVRGVSVPDPHLVRCGRRLRSAAPARAPPRVATT